MYQELLYGALVGLLWPAMRYLRHYVRYRIALDRAHNLLRTTR